MISKTITITEEQDRWVKDRYINLSKYVRACIEKARKTDPYESDECVDCAFEPRKGMFDDDEIKTGKGGRV